MKTFLSISLIFCAASAFAADRSREHSRLHRIADQPGKILFDGAEAQAPLALPVEAPLALGESAAVALAPQAQEVRGTAPSAAVPAPSPRAESKHPISEALSLMPKWMFTVVNLGWLLEGVARAAGDEGPAAQAVEAAYYALPAAVLSITWGVSRLEAKRLAPFSHSELADLSRNFAQLKAMHAEETRVKRLVDSTEPAMRGVLEDLRRGLPDSRKAALEPRIETLERFLESAGGGRLAGWSRQDVALGLIAAAERPLSAYVELHGADARVRRIRKALKNAAVPDPELGPT